MSTTGDPAGPAPRTASMQERRLERAALILDIVGEFATHQQLHSLLAAVAKRCAEVFGEWCGVYRADRDPNVLVLDALYHADAAEVERVFDVLREVPLHRADPVVTSILDGRRPVVMEMSDPATRASLDHLPVIAGTVQRLRLSSVLQVPLYVAAGPVGLLSIGSEAPRHWDDEDLRTASVIADRAATAIENARLIESEQAARRLAEQEAEHVRRLQAEDRLLTTIVSATAGEPDIQVILSVTLEHLRPVVRFTGGSVALVEGDDLVVRAAVGPFAQQALGHRLRRGEGRLWHVVETGASFLSGDLLAEGLAPSTPIRSYVARPLVWREEAFGILEVDSTEPGAFAEPDAALLDRVSRVLSGAIQLARRYAGEMEALARAESLARHLSRLQGVTAALSGAETPAQIARIIVDEGISAVGALAGSLSVTRDGGRTLELVRAVGYPEDFPAKWASVPAEFRPAAAEALRRGKPIFFPSAETMTAALYHPVTGPYALLPYQGARAIAPLRTSRGTLGVLSFAFPGPRGFSDEDRALIGTLSDQCAQALDRASRYEREHRVAETLQRALLPPALPDVPGVALRAAYRAGGQLEVGGDWYDAFLLPDGRLVICIGDVVGRGLGAAVVMGQVRQSIRAVALAGEEPAAILEHAGTMLSRAHGSDGMATAVVGTFDPATLEFVYAAAGHPPPILAAPGGRLDRFVAGGPPLGAGVDASYAQSTAVLPPGGMLVLYTDGLVESSRDVAAGEETLLRAIAEEIARPSDDPAGGILARAAAAQRLVDDLAIVTLGLPDAEFEGFEVSVPADPSALARVRPALRRLASNAGLDADRTMALLVASGEALANAVLHAYSTEAGVVHVRARLGPAGVSVEVEDEGVWRESGRAGGHGLALIRQLADESSIEAGRAGTMVRLVVRGPAPAI